MIKINKGKRFQQAVDSVEDYLKKAKGKEQVIALYNNTENKNMEQYLQINSTVSCVMTNKTNGWLIIMHLT